MRHLTNREWLATLTNKEFAEFMTYGLAVRRRGCDSDAPIYISADSIARGFMNSQTGFEEWLEQEQQYKVMKQW